MTREFFEFVNTAYEYHQRRQQSKTAAETVTVMPQEPPISHRALMYAAGSGFLLQFAGAAYLAFNPQNVITRTLAMDAALMAPFIVAGVALKKNL